MRGNNESIGEIPAKYVQWKTKIDCKRDEKGVRLESVRSL